MQSTLCICITLWVYHAQMMGHFGMMAITGVANAAKGEKFTSHQLKKAP